jgi:WD40 repeat protein
VLVAGGVSAKLYDVQTGERVTEGPRQNEHGVSAVALSRDGLRIATGGMDGVVRVWDARTGEPLTPPLVHSVGGKIASDSQAVNHVAFSPDSSLVASSSSDGQTRIWNIATGAPAAPPLSDADQYATFSPDGRWIATAGASGLVRVWSVRTGAAVSPPFRHSDVATCVAFDAQGLRLVSASLDGTARVWDLAPDPRPLEELQRLAEVLAGRRIDETGGVVDLTTDELRARWEALQRGTRR